jgi:hypothetical protein
MRTILALCGLILVIGAALLWAALRVPTDYGVFVGAPRAAVADVIERPADFLHKIVALDDVVRNQCTTMGCYFFFQANGRLIRIELAEITMTAPKGRNERRARVEGQLVPYGDGYQVIASAVRFE